MCCPSLWFAPLFVCCFDLGIMRCDERCWTLGLHPVAGRPWFAAVMHLCYVVTSSVWPLHESNLVCGDVRQRLFVHTMYSSNVWVPGCVCGLLGGFVCSTAEGGTVPRQCTGHVYYFCACRLVSGAGSSGPASTGQSFWGQFRPGMEHTAVSMFDSWVPTSAFFPYTRPLTLLEPRSPATQSLDRAVAQGATTAW